MAQEIVVRGANVKIQSLVTQLLLMIVTFGIYWWFWYYRVNKEMKDVGTAVGDAGLASSSPGMSILATTLGAFILVPYFISVYNAGKRMEQTQRVLGMNPPSFNNVVHVLLMFFTGLFPLYDQAELNKLWHQALISEQSAIAAA